MRLILYPYKMASASARDLQRTLQERGIRCVRVKENGAYRPRRGDLVVNWGNSSVPTWERLRRVRGVRLLNSYDITRTCSNKLAFARATETWGGCALPLYSLRDAEEWMRANVGRKVVCRTVLNGNSGKGIVIAPSESNVPTFVSLFHLLKVIVVHYTCIHVLQRKQAEFFDNIFGSKGVPWQHKPFPWAVSAVEWQN